VNVYRFAAPHRSTVRFGPEYRAEAFVVPAAHDETLLVSAAFTTSAGGAPLVARALRGNVYVRAAAHRLGATIVCQDAALAEAEGLDELRGTRWTGEHTRGALTPSDGAVVRVRDWVRRSGGPPLRPARGAVREWRPRAQLSVWEMHTRDCPTCRRAHADAQAAGTVLLGASVAAAAAGHVGVALALAALSEACRAAVRWLEVFDVDFHAP
jgi:hypothetical protein